VEHGSSGAVHCGDGVLSAVRVFFATDVHGSETCWRKFLRCHEFYDADVVVLGGDMTGKSLVPIVGNGAGHYRTYLQEQRHEFDGEEELARYKQVIRGRGLYPFVTTDEELAELKETPGRLEEIFHEAIVKTVEEWVALADERLAHAKVRAFVCPGNDDFPSIDEVIRTSSRLELAEGRVIELDGGYELLSTGWSNRTPWQTEREEDEEQLGARIEAMLGRATAPPERLVFNFHCPPYGTSLDEAPQLEDDLSVVSAGRVLAHVGSTAVRDAIDRVQPIVSLHGHIHEARGTARLGRTLSINPGSSYETGVLLGAIVELDGKGKAKRYQLTTG
jgi:Icc-related predicted phosphoesterase